MKTTCDTCNTHSRHTSFLGIFNIAGVTECPLGKNCILNSKGGSVLWQSQVYTASAQAPVTRLDLPANTHTSEQPQHQLL